MVRILVLDNNLKNKDLSLKDVGMNYGNMCFYYGCLDIFKNHDIYYLNDNNIEKPDYIVVSIANSICNIKSCNNHLKHLNNIMSKFSCKKILLSIGAQNNDLSLFSLKEEYKIIINDFLKQFDFINLRGTYTQDILIHNDIKYNYHVLGCPSIYLCKPIKNMSNFGKMDLESKILFNSPRYWTGKKKTQVNCDFIYDLINDPTLDFLNQDICDNKKNIYVPKNFNNWKKIVSKYEFIIGTRIHGAIMALICNIPTILLVIDSRTYELAEIFKIPYINLIDKNISLKDKSDVVKLINSYTLDYNNYNKCLEEYKKNIRLKLLEPFNLN